MKFDAKKAKTSGISAAAAMAGGAVSHKVGKILEEKAPENFKKHVPLAIAAACILAPSFLNIKDENVESALIGGAAIAGYNALNNLSIDETTGVAATTGPKSFIAKYVPQLGSIDYSYGYSYPTFQPYEEVGSSLERAGRLALTEGTAQTQASVVNLF